MFIFSVGKQLYSDCDYTTLAGSLSFVLAQEDTFCKQLQLQIIHNI